MENSKFYGISDEFCHQVSVFANQLVIENNPFVPYEGNSLVLCRMALLDLSQSIDWRQSIISLYKTISVLEDKERDILYRTCTSIAMGFSSTPLADIDRCMSDLGGKTCLKPLEVFQWGLLVIMLPEETFTTDMLENFQLGLVKFIGKLFLADMSYARFEDRVNSKNWAPLRYLLHMADLFSGSFMGKPAALEEEDVAKLKLTDEDHVAIEFTDCMDYNLIQGTQLDLPFVLESLGVLGKDFSNQLDIAIANIKELFSKNSEPMKVDFVEMCHSAAVSKEKFFSFKDKHKSSKRYEGIDRVKACVLFMIMLSLQLDKRRDTVASTIAYAVLTELANHDDDLPGLEIVTQTLQDDIYKHPKTLYWLSNSLLSCKMKHENWRSSRYDQLIGPLLSHYGLK